MAKKPQEEQTTTPKLERLKCMRTFASDVERHDIVRIVFGTGNEYTGYYHSWENLGNQRAVVYLRPERFIISDTPCKRFVYNREGDITDCAYQILLRNSQREALLKE